MPILSWLFTKPLPPGTPAPDFTLPDQDGRPVNLRDLRGRQVILVFYPGDDTRVCTQQLCELRDSTQELAARNTVVLGINPQGEESHKHFRDRYGFTFQLLIDKGSKVAGLYNAGGIIIRRTVYLIGADGVIRYSNRGKPSVKEILASAA